LRNAGFRKAWLRNAGFGKKTDSQDGEIYNVEHVKLNMLINQLKDLLNQLRGSADKDFPSEAIDPEYVEDKILWEDAYINNLEGDYRTKEVQKDIAERFLKGDWGGGARDNQYSQLITYDKETRYWFIGDIHSDYEALCVIRAWVEEMQKKSPKKQHLIFLGDLFDRGKDDFEVLACILDMIMKQDQYVKVSCIKGNHDEGIKYDGKQFSASVEPAEMVARLNQLIGKGEKDLADIFGRAAIKLASTSFRMLEIDQFDEAHPENTILLTHGGVPHTDVQKIISGICQDNCAVGESDLISCFPEKSIKLATQDYTWLRFDDKLPRKQPNRGSKGCQIGTEDVATYRLLHHSLTGRRITFIIRGHDHESRLSSYDSEYNPVSSKFIQKACGVLTTCAMTHDYKYEDKSEKGTSVVCMESGSQLKLYRFSKKEN
jgi:hypothetical protein